MSYQDRYLRHQARKKLQLLLAFRRSQRVFNGKPIDDNVFHDILFTATTSPSSCNRHGLKLKVIRERRDKELLGGLLVGGVGWVHRADRIILFLADPVAYASPNEKEFMHYADVGFTALPMWLMAEGYGLGAAYINPNLVNKAVFDEYFGKGLIFCGALALGHYEEGYRPEMAEPGILSEMLI
jgi:nitroreductase